MKIEKFLLDLTTKGNNQGKPRVVQWLGISAFTCVGLSSIPDKGTMIPKATTHDQKKKRFNNQEIIIKCNDEGRASWQ